MQLWKCLSLFSPVSPPRIRVLSSCCCLLSSCVGVLGVSVAQTVTISPVGAVIAAEGDNLTITCTDRNSSGSTLRLREDGVELTGSNFPLNTVSDLMRTFALPVDRTRNGTTYDCFSGTTLVSSEAIILIAVCKWKGSVVRYYTRTQLWQYICGVDPRSHEYSSGYDSVTPAQPSLRQLLSIHPYHIQKYA